MIQKLFDTYLALEKDEKLFFLLCIIFIICVLLLSATVVRSEKRYVSKMINVIELPEYIIIDKNEIVYSGGNTPEVLGMRIDTLLQYRKDDLKVYSKTTDTYTRIIYSIILGFNDKIKPP